jgi:hypothetical protein
MRPVFAFLALLAISTPVFSQSQANDQDHTAHHPATVDNGNSTPTASAPAGSGAVGSKAAPQSTVAPSGGCAMMPDMMQSMMKGMMQGMVASGQGMVGQQAMMADAGRMAQSSSGAMAGAVNGDTSIAALTQRALIERTRNALSANTGGGDADFVRLAVVLQEALVDVAKAASAFGVSAETRQKAQAFTTTNEAELTVLKNWSNSLKK